MFKEEREKSLFTWSCLGNIAEGRPHLGDVTSVTAYRLMQYTLRDVLIQRLSPQTAGEIMYESGKNAGKAFCENLLDINLPFDAFIAHLQQILKEHKIGIFRLEAPPADQSGIFITIAEDLDCSGLPVSDETVCDYDEGFIAGILEVYKGIPFDVKEIDCWATGARVCRFRAVEGDPA